MKRRGLRDRSSGPRRAFTLVELLTTLSIIGLLLALIIPAVQMARESARRSQCSNNLRQLGLALANYVSTYDTFPRAGTSKGYSVLSVMLPFLDQRPLYDALNFSISVADNFPSWANMTASHVAVAVFLCPSDGPVTSGGARAWTSYAGNRGVYRRHIYSDNGAFVAMGDSIYLSLASFTDGMSTTAAMSEWILGPLVWSRRDPRGTVYRTTTPLGPAAEFDHFARECHDLDPGSAELNANDKGSPWHLSGYMHTNYNHILGPNDHSCNPGGWVQYGAYSAGSRHPGGVNLLWTDGHLSFSNEKINIETRRAIGTRNGADVVAGGEL